MANSTNQSLMSQMGMGDDTPHSCVQKMLKCLIEMIHTDHAIIDLQLGRPIKLEDFNCLSSENMLKILAFLLGFMPGKKSAISNITKLTDFGRISGEDCYYDCGPDHIYHSIKALFPEESNLFHYSMLLLPAKEPRKTKLVLYYIMEFVLMSDKLTERFSAAREEAEIENNEKADISTEIDSLQEQINNLIYETSRAKARLPILQREFDDLQQVIGKEQVEFSRLNKKLEAAKTVYEDKENKNKIMQLKLEAMEVEITKLTSQRVSDPVQISADNERLKQRFEAYSIQRTILGGDLEKCRKECTVYEELVVRAKETIKKFDDVTELMTNVTRKMECGAKSKHEIQNLSRKLRELKTEAEQLAKRHNEKTKIADSIKQTYDSKQEKVKKETTQLKRQIEDIKRETKCVNGEICQLSESILKMEEELKNLEVEIAQYVKEVSVNIPQRKEEANARMVEILENSFREFSRFPAEAIQPED